jgi:hypothetical protein
MVVLKKRKAHKKFFVHFGLFTVLLSGMWIDGSPNVGAAPFDYSDYQQFLAKYVVPGKRGAKDELEMLYIVFLLFLPRELFLDILFCDILSTQSEGK